MTQLARRRSKVTGIQLAPRSLSRGIEKLETRNLLATSITCEPAAWFDTRATGEKVEIAAETSIASRVEGDVEASQAGNLLLLSQAYDDQTPAWQVPVATTSPTLAAGVVDVAYDPWRPYIPTSWEANHATHSTVRATFVNQTHDLTQRDADALSRPTDQGHNLQPTETALAIIDDAIQSLQADLQEWPTEPHAVSLAVDVNGDALTELGVLYAGTWVFDINHNGEFDGHDVSFQSQRELRVGETAKANETDQAKQTSATSSLSEHERVLRSVVANLGADSLAALTRGEGLPLFLVPGHPADLAVRGAEKVSQPLPEEISPVTATPERNSSVPENPVSASRIANSPPATTR